MFGEQEQSLLSLDESRSTISFADLWVRKEALVKATGCSLEYALGRSVLEDHLYLDGLTWHFTSVDFQTKYSCAIASSFDPGTLCVRMIAMGDLI
jgi:phosphopantetheinyl transferase